MMGFEKKFICLTNKSIVLSSLSRRRVDGHIQQTGFSEILSMHGAQFNWEWKVSWCVRVNNSNSLFLQNKDK